MPRHASWCAAVALLLLPGVAVAQEPAGVLRELLDDVTAAEGKIVALAKAVPPEKYGWRPADGVRSTGEVFVHIAGDNYFLPALAGVAPPPETGIVVSDFATVGRFEARRLTRDQIVAELSASFAHLKRAMAGTSPAALEQPPVASKSGRHPTTRQLWIATVSHLHEHLGQLIAYARSNGVTPPWSK